MDRNEAKLLLQAYRTNGEDAARPVFADALALAERDPELKAWWEAQKAFDQKFSAKLKEVPIPANLRETILAGRKIEQLTPRSRLPHWLAIAAMLMALLFLGNYLRPVSGPADKTDLASSDYRTGVIGFLGDDSPSLGTTSTNHAELVAWLKTRNSPTGIIPSTMGSLPSVGCQTFAVHGHTVSLICFSLANGGIVHLFVIDRKALMNPPGSSPEFNQMKEWSTATWSDDSKSYILATEAGPDVLKGLL